MNHTAVLCGSTWSDCRGAFESEDSGAGKVVTKERNDCSSPPSRVKEELRGSNECSLMGTLQQRLVSPEQRQCSPLKRTVNSLFCKRSRDRNPPHHHHHHPRVCAFQTEHQRVLHPWRRHHSQYDHGERRRGLQRHTGGDGRQLWPEDTSHSQPTGVAQARFHLLSWSACRQPAGVQGHPGRRTHAHSFVVSNPCQEFERQIKEWCKEAGEDVTYEFAQVCVWVCERENVPPLQTSSLLWLEAKRAAVHCRNIWTRISRRRRRTILGGGPSAEPAERCECAARAVSHRHICHISSERLCLTFLRIIIRIIL